MKIIQIGDYPQDKNLIKGGVQASIYGLTQSLVRLSNDVAVISMPTRDIEKDSIVKKDNLTTYHFGNKYHYQILSIFYLKTILSVIKKEKPDVVHIHGTSLLALLLIAILRLKKTNVVITIHGIVYIEFLKSLKRKKSVLTFIKLIVYFLIEFTYINLSKQIIVDTQYVADVLKRITRRYIKVIPQGIDDSFYSVPDSFVGNNIISIGVISPRKGYEYSIEAIAMLVKDGFPHLRFDIVGILNEDNKPYFDRLNNLIARNNLESNIRFHTNILFDDLQRLLSEANLFILHSSEESQGIVLCEAMAARKPIVATNVGGIPYVVKDNENGFLVPYGDVDSFATMIKKILQDPPLRKQMSDNSFHLSQQYKWDNIAKEIISTIYL